MKRRYELGLLRCRSLLLLLLQASLIFCSLVCSWLLRFEFRLPDPWMLFVAAPVLVAIRLSLMPWFNLMHGWWRYTGISDALDVLKAIATGSFMFLAITRYGLCLKAFPLSIYTLEALITFVLLAGVRVMSRMLAATVRQDSLRKRLLLVGAGFAAQMIIRETQQAETGYRVMGCVDDDPLKKGLKVLGVAVEGPVEILGRIVCERRIDEVLIAIPSAAQAQMCRFVELCKEAGVPFRTVPRLAELITGQVMLQQVREVRVEDLLGRKPVRLDPAPVRTQIQNRVVMVTGAAGSIGSELCQQILQYNPALLVCVDQNETGIFHLQQRLDMGNGKERMAAERCVFCVADICNPDRMRRIFAAHPVEIVFHAAAYKHVPMMEANVEEAVSNNVAGLLSLLHVAHNAGCGSFVMISSDKAVNPTSVMGCTKRVGELILAAWPANGLRCVSVRFGNVLGSNGSVVPLFQEQISRNQPITITHPEITRFFMTIPEAVALVLQAFAVGKHGDILVLDMGEPVRILDLAQTLIRLSGGHGHGIQFTGLRPGEKLFEELFYPWEQILPTSCEKVKCTESIPLRWSELQVRLDALYVALSMGQPDSILAEMKKIVPEFSYTKIDLPGLAPELPFTKSTTQSVGIHFTGPNARSLSYPHPTALYVQPVAQTTADVPD